jgi:hypothetical protein
MTGAIHADLTDAKAAAGSRSAGRRTARKAGGRVTEIPRGGFGPPQAFILGQPQGLAQFPYDVKHPVLKGLRLRQTAAEYQPVDVFLRDNYHINVLYCRCAVSFFSGYHPYTSFQGIGVFAVLRNGVFRVFIPQGIRHILSHRPPFAVLLDKAYQALIPRLSFDRFSHAAPPVLAGTASPTPTGEAEAGMFSIETCTVPAEPKHRIRYCYRR